MKGLTLRSDHEKLEAELERSSALPDASWGPGACRVIALVSSDSLGLETSS